MLLEITSFIHGNEIIIESIGKILAGRCSIFRLLQFYTCEPKKSYHYIKTTPVSNEMLIFSSSFSLELFQKKIQIGRGWGVKDMEFPTELKKQSVEELQWSIKIQKEWKFQGSSRKKVMWNFLHGPWFLDLEFSGVVTQFRSYEFFFFFFASFLISLLFFIYNTKSNQSHVCFPLV